MTLLPFVAIAGGFGGLSLLALGAFRWRRGSAAIGLAGLLLALVAATMVRDETPVLLGGVELGGSAMAARYLGLASVAGLLLASIGAAGAWSPTLPGATLLALSAAGLGLGSADPLVALAAVSIGGLAAVAVVTPLGTVDRVAAVVGRELRGVAVAIALSVTGVALVAAAAAGSPGRPGADGPALVGLGYLAVAAAVAIRLGTIPFHLRAARSADAAPDIALPLLLVWAPGGFALVALGWFEAGLQPLGAELAVERGIVVLAALASIVFGAAAMLLHDDLEHVLAYAVVADGGVVLLALAALGPEARDAGGTWLIALVAGKSALAAWVAAVRITYGTAQLRELGGWARRSPVLGLVLVVVTLAGVGWPGMAVFEARAALVELAAGGIPGAVLLAGSLATGAAYLRLLAVGVRRPGGMVRGVPGALVVRPPAPPRPGPSVAATVAAVLRANRVPLAGAAALALAGLAVVVSGGGLGVGDARAGTDAAYSSGASTQRSISRS